MADQQKPTVELPDVSKHDTAAAEQTVAADAAAAATQDEPAGPESKPVDDASASKTDDKKDDVKTIDEGHLAHKAQGASFPKNLIPSKEFLFFGSDAFDPKALLHYHKSEKSTETAQKNIAWASHTGKGLLFFGDKKAPTSVIHLADASEPEVDGSNKFHFTSKGNKHSFKANSTAERDGWVAQLKLKIAEAKELAATVTESDVYKNTLEGFLKPAPVAAKEDKAGENAAKAEDAANAEDAPKEGEAAKGRSASRKRASFFGFGKKEEKKDESKAEDVAANESPEPVAETEDVAATDAQPTATEDKPADEAVPAESPKEKPAVSKRNSFFGGVFSKKEKKAIEMTKPAEGATELPKEGDATVADTAAPVIPPVESTTPLAVDVSSPATVPTENVETTAINGEPKKDVKEKRKSSLPFAFGKRDKSPTPADSEEKSGMSAFSKLRATIKGKTASKTEEKPSGEGVKDGAVAVEPARDNAAGEAAKDVTPSADAVKAANPEAENKPENVAAPAPVVTAAA